MLPANLFAFVLRQTNRPDLALHALAHAVTSPDVLVDYAEALRAVVSHLSPSLRRLEGRVKLRSHTPRLLPHAVVLGLTHAALKGRRPRVWAWLPADELETCLALHGEARGYTAPGAMKGPELVARVLARPHDWRSRLLCGRKP